MHHLAEDVGIPNYFLDSQAENTGICGIFAVFVGQQAGDAGRFPDLVSG